MPARRLAARLPRMRRCGFGRSTPRAPPNKHGAKLAFEFHNRTSSHAAPRKPSRAGRPGSCVQRHEVLRAEPRMQVLERRNDNQSGGIHRLFRLAEDRLSPSVLMHCQFGVDGVHANIKRRPLAFEGFGARLDEDAQHTEVRIDRPGLRRHRRFKITGWI